MASREHLHGWDLTFSAPKSVSLAALVGGDERLVVAHDAAVRETLVWLQENALITRPRSDGQVIEEQTGQMLAAVFRHDLSRAAEPQLHSHAVVMNATIGADEKWRSVHSIRLYVNLKEAGERYQQALAMRAAELGYAIVPSRNGTFELDGVPREIALMFSSRAKAVEARLAEQGLTRASATAWTTRGRRLAHAQRQAGDRSRRPTRAGPCACPRRRPGSGAVRRPGQTARRRARDRTRQQPRARAKPLADSWPRADHTGGAGTARGARGGANLERARRRVYRQSARATRPVHVIGPRQCYPDRARDQLTLPSVASWWSARCGRSTRRPSSPRCNRAGPPPS